MDLTSIKLIPLLALATISLFARAGDFMVGADLSAATVVEERGARFFEGGQEKDLFQIFKDNGYNTIRLRLFLEADGRWDAVNDLPYTLELAQRVKQHGFRLLLDFHYSDTWADPAHQYTPGIWKDMYQGELELAVFEYTRESLKAFEEKNALPDYIQIGNEITPGMLWPNGKVSVKRESIEDQWINFTNLLKAGIRGVRAIDPDEQIKIILHVHNGASTEITVSFFDRIRLHDVPYDIIGLSYYPWMHGPLHDVEETLRQIGEKYKKDVIIAETAYPYRTLHHTRHGLEFPQTPEGQRAFLSALTRAVRNTPQRHGKGIFYWYPESVPTQHHRPWMGGTTALFDTEGHALPALGTVAEQASCTSAACSALVSTPTQ